MSQSREKLRRELLRIESFRTAAERALSSGILAEANIEVVYEAGFLSAFVAFENFMEDIFVEIMCGKHIPAGCRFSRRVEFRSSAVAREALYDGRSYVDLFPFNHLKRKAKLFFRGGRPFTTLDNSEIRELEFFQRVRNLVAHRSRSSLNLFVVALNIRVQLPPSRRTAAKYLRSRFSANETWFEHDIQVLMSIAGKLAK